MVVLHLHLPPPSTEISTTGGERTNPVDRETNPVGGTDNVLVYDEDNVVNQTYYQIDGAFEDYGSAGDPSGLTDEQRVYSVKLRNYVSGTSTNDAANPNADTGEQVIVANQISFFSTNTAITNVDGDDERDLRTNTYFRIQKNALTAEITANVEVGYTNIATGGPSLTNLVSVRINVSPLDLSSDDIREEGRQAVSSRIGNITVGQQDNLSVSVDIKSLIDLASEYELAVISDFRVAVNNINRVGGKEGDPTITARTGDVNDGTGSANLNFHSIPNNGEADDVEYTFDLVFRAADGSRRVTEEFTLPGKLTKRGTAYAPPGVITAAGVLNAAGDGLLSAGARIEVTNGVTTTLRVGITTNGMTSQAVFDNSRFAFGNLTGSIVLNDSNNLVGSLAVTAGTGGVAKISVGPRFRVGKATYSSDAFVPEITASNPSYQPSPARSLSFVLSSTFSITQFGSNNPPVSVNANNAFGFNKISNKPVLLTDFINRADDDTGGFIFFYPPEVTSMDGVENGYTTSILGNAYNNVQNVNAAQYVHITTNANQALQGGVTKEGGGDSVVVRSAAGNATLFSYIIDPNFVFFGNFNITFNATVTGANGTSGFVATSNNGDSSNFTGRKRVLANNNGNDRDHVIRNLEVRGGQAIILSILAHNGAVITLHSITIAPL